MHNTGQIPRPHVYRAIPLLFICSPESKPQIACPKPSSSSSEITFPDDAFLMVTQANWEEDIIWNGEDIKHKVLQKLNSKTNAAGWVPTGAARSFAGAGVPGGGGGQSGSKGGVPEVKYQVRFFHQIHVNVQGYWSS